MKRMREIDRGRVVHGFVADGQCLVKNSFWDREPVQWLKQRGDVLAFALSKDDACRVVLDALKRLNGGGWDALFGNSQKKQVYSRIGPIPTKSGTYSFFLSKY